MSQKKVDIYKESKVNRDKRYKKEKAMEKLEFTIVGLVCAAIIGWIGYSAYGHITMQKESQVQEIALDTSAVDEYLGSLSETEQE